MAVPTSYTEEAFAEFLHGELGETAVLLQLSPPNSYAEIINDTLIELDESDIGNLTGMANIKKLRTVGRWQAWQTATAGLVGEINYSADGAKFDREAIYQHAKQQASRWQAEAMPYLAVYQVTIETVGYHPDPYGSQA